MSGLNANDENLERVYRVLAHLPNCEERKVCVYELVGGLTNINYRAHVGSNDYFVRCGLNNNGLLGVSLEREWACASRASASGFAPTTVYFSSGEHVFITGFIETGNRVVNLRHPASKQKFCRLIRSLHQSDVKFDNEFCPFRAIKFYMENAADLQVELPMEFFSVILPWADSFQSNCFPMFDPVPGHFDLHNGNVLDDGERFWLIDWEYAGMGDPFFDLATAASLENFSNEEMKEFLQTYLGREPTLKETSYFYCMRILADIRWSLWCYLQSKISPKADLPFIPFGEFYLQNALDRLAI